MDENEDKLKDKFKFKFKPKINIKETLSQKEIIFKDVQVDLSYQHFFDENTDVKIQAKLDIDDASVKSASIMATKKF